jgi:hypothetical protein
MLGARPAGRAGQCITRSGAGGPGETSGIISMSAEASDQISVP